MKKSPYLEGMDKFLREGLSKTDQKKISEYYLLKKLNPSFNSLSQRKFQVLKASPVYYFESLKRYLNTAFFSLE